MFVTGVKVMCRWCESGESTGVKCFNITVVKVAVVQWYHNAGVEVVYQRCRKESKMPVKTSHLIHK